MPRFYFDIEGESERDEEGVDLADLREAEAYSVDLLCNLLRNRSSEFWATRDYAISVADDQRLTLFVLNLVAVRSLALTDPRVRRG